MFLLLFPGLGVGWRVSAQQPNTLGATLSINGTGRHDPGVATTNSMVSPTPAGSAPLYHHVAAARVPIQIRTDGPVLQPVILAHAPPIAASSLGTSGGLLELDPAGMQILVNGAAPTSWLSHGANTGPWGSWTLTLSAGLPAAVAPAHFQAAVLDPAVPAGYTLSASVTLDVRNDIDTVLRNFVDAWLQAVESPLYLLGTTSSGFLWYGRDRWQLLAFAATLQAERSTYFGNGANTTTSAAPPGGPPVPGQEATMFIETGHSQAAGCGTLPPVGRHGRDYGFHVVEEGGVWKVAGNQHEFRHDVLIRFFHDPASPQGFVTKLKVEIQDDFGLHGGIALAEVQGPQLQAINSSAEAVSASAGTQPLTLISGGGGGPSEWELWVRLAAPNTTSRQPLVENATGVRDAYALTVTWNDGSVSGPYSVPLRSGVDPASDPTGMLQAFPLRTGTPTGQLNNAGTANATIDLTFELGFLPAGLDGTVEISGWESVPVPMRFEVSGLLVNTSLSTQAVTVCVLGFHNTADVTIQVGHSDILGAEWNNTFSFVP